LIWKYAHIEEKWTAKISNTPSAGQFEKDLAIRYEADVPAGRM
jgi:hypothetical protein